MKLEPPASAPKPRRWRKWAMAGSFLVAAAILAYFAWSPGLDLRDGRHDRGSNGIWLAHGWLGGDEWFLAHHKTNEFARYRDPAKIQALADNLRRHHISDLFPHLCPAGPDGSLPSVDDRQVERFLDACGGCRVIPWIGGAAEIQLTMRRPAWRAAFTGNVRALLQAHPRLGGVQLNIEPLPSGDTNFLRLLEDLHASLPPGKILSVAAYPPPTWWHPYPEVHWDESYFRAVAKRCDQLAVMLYDAAQKIPKTYEQLMGDWTREVLNWSEGKAILLGVPTYDDSGVGYHDPRVENLIHALAGIHRGLGTGPPPAAYQGVAIYCEWETDEGEWRQWRERFLKLPGLSP